MAGSQAGGLTVRSLDGPEEMREAVRLQQEIWGFEEPDLVPVRLFVVASHVGGQTLGAFDNGRMVGFCLAFPGLKPDGTTFLHSQMLGVAASHRNSGIGRKLKLAQREDALARGITLVEWTFDPLEIKNAYFNLERLGAVVRRHVYNQYGITTSPLHAGLPTDRCIAEWWLASPRVEAILAGEAAPRPEIVARINVPAAISRLRTEDMSGARTILAGVSGLFQEHFRQGLAATGFELSAGAGTYLLSRWDSQ